MKKRALSEKELFAVAAVAYLFKIIFAGTPIAEGAFGLLFVICFLLALVALIPRPHQKDAVKTQQKPS